MTTTTADVIGRARLGPIADAVAGAIHDLVERDALHRMCVRDHTLWSDDPTEIADRLGWLSVVGEMAEQVGELEAMAAEAAADGLRHAVLLGMGGSSLFPEVLWRSFGSGPAHLDLTVLDTTDPAAIARVSAELDLDACLFVAASKSGTTIETTSQLAHFWELTGGDARRFMVVSDPGTELARLGQERGFRRVYENRPDIGGRYSALSHFGVVPGALLGYDVARLLERAAEAAEALGPAVPAADHPAVRLGAALGAAAKAGRDKLTLVLPDEIATFGLWLEQLVAESTGKQGTGILPVAGEALGPPEVYGDDRLFVSIGGADRHTGLDALAEAGHPVVELAFEGPDDLGALVFLWEMTVALSGAVLGIIPFDQPDVASAKEATGKVLDAGLPDIEHTPVAELLEAVRPGDYLAIQAFVDPGDSALLEGIEQARLRLRDRLRVATTMGVGPRFLHSTGQLHKGGPPSGVFLQVLGDPGPDVPIPGQPYGFGTLIQAQAAGDLQALRDRGLRAGRVTTEELLSS
ncbi:MAG: glucose-6-phosphate isomerase [Acidimicrobiia bacterium]|nr:glucose-6-phosphate isomerase [Acidimicrobiia bacterium]